MSRGRDAAGMHYRHDSEGMILGEQVAIGFLKDYSHTYNEEFNGFQFTRFDGKPMRVVAGKEREHPKWFHSKHPRRLWPVRETL